MPRYIHELPDWPRFRWDAGVLIERLGDVHLAQGLHLDKLRALGLELRQEAQAEVLTEDAVGSARIEGVDLERAKVRSSVARRLGLESGGFEPRSRHIEGMVSVLVDATQRAEVTLTADRLCSWHAALFPTGRNEHHQPIAVGRWRDPEADPMQVISGMFGSEVVHFEAPSSDRLAAEMEAFLAWVERREGDPIIAAGIGHLWFETLHPFEDGNGRLGRAIADLMLTRADKASVRSYSLSSQIDATKKSYYDQLERAQKGDLDVTPWLAWFIDCVGGAIARSEGILEGVFARHAFWQRAAAHPLNERQKKVVARWREDFLGPLTTAKYAKIAKCSPDAALRDVNELIGWGLLAQNPGGGRSTSYRLVGVGESEGDDPRHRES